MITSAVPTHPALTDRPAKADTTDASDTVGAIHTSDARDASTQTHISSAPVPGPDLRSVDARDAAQAPDGAVTRVDPPALKVVPVASGGFHWDDAAIGAGGALGLVLILAGGTAAITRRHRTAGRLATS